VSDAVVLDTNIVSFLVKGDLVLQRYEEDLRDRRHCISFITVGELRFWARSRRWGSAKTEHLEQTIQSFLVLPFDDAVAHAWADIATEAKANGRDRVDRSDWWIAACAIRHGVPLVTHNRRDFEGISRLTVISHADPP
jgi:predicted nucleic acid-binding protein